MTYRSIPLKLPPDLPAARYAAIVYAVFSVLDPAGLVGVTSVRVDELAADELHQAFDTHSERCPWRL